MSSTSLSVAEGRTERLALEVNRKQLAGTRYVIDEVAQLLLHPQS